MVSVSSRRACGARAQATIDARTARRLRLGDARARVVVGSGVKSLRGGRARLTVRFTVTAARRMRRARSVRVRVSTRSTAEQAGRVSRPAVRALTLRR